MRSDCKFCGNLLTEFEMRHQDSTCDACELEREKSPSEQAVAIRTLYRTLVRLGPRAIVLHRLHDVSIGRADNIENGCGLLDLRGAAKPAWRALRRLRE